MQQLIGFFKSNTESKEIFLGQSCRGFPLPFIPYIFIANWHDKLLVQSKCLCVNHSNTIFQFATSLLIRKELLAVQYFRLFKITFRRMKDKKCRAAFYQT